MKVDDEYIAISNFQGETTRSYFISKKTLDLHWSMQFDGNNIGNLSFAQGLLLVYVSKHNDKSEKYGFIHVYDVTSRKYLREMPTAALDHVITFSYKVRFNSNFMVVFEKPSDYRLPYQMNIYDLIAVKNPNSSADELLVHTLIADFDLKMIMVTETEIFGWSFQKIGILDFSSFNVLKNATNSVTLSLPWRSVWRSIGVDEEERSKSKDHCPAASKPTIMMEAFFS